MIIIFIIVTYYNWLYTIVIIMPSTICTISHFNEGEEEFDSYLARINLFFTANEIKDDKKVASFLTLGGPKIYALTKSLLSPKDPASCSFKEITDALKAHYKPRVIVIYERYKFYSRSQKSGESVADFVAAIKALAHSCEFGTGLNDMLRDRFVMGLSNEITQHTLLAEADLTFARAVEVATAREAAIRDAQAMGSTGGTGTVHHLNKKYNAKSNVSMSKSKNKSKSNSNVSTNAYKGSNSSSSNNPKTPCSGCGCLHWKKDCPFKSAECHLCKKLDTLRKCVLKQRLKRKVWVM